MQARDKGGPVLITGGAGYIGSHTAWACLDAGRKVVVVDNLSTGRRELALRARCSWRATWPTTALIGRAIAEHGVRSVIHFAAKTVVPDSIADPLGYYRSNLGCTLSLIESCVAAGVSSFVFSSTAAV